MEYRSKLEQEVQSDNGVLVGDKEIGGKLNNNYINIENTNSDNRNFLQKFFDWYSVKVLRVPKEAKVAHYTVPGVIASSGFGKSR